MTPCRHFGDCGGCVLQGQENYSSRKRATVAQALARAGLGAARVEAPVQVAEKTRRRATFKLAQGGQGLEIGFHAARSHQIVDMHECLVLTPELFALVGGLRAALGDVVQGGEKLDLHITQSDTGFDLGFRWARKLTPALTARIADAVSHLPIARINFNKDMLLEHQAPMVHFDGIAAALPPNAFLQPTMQGEAALRGHVLALTEGAKTVLDLFAGLGTFALPLARRAKVHAVEQDDAALAALAAAARKARSLKPVTTEKRDLFKLPLTALELNRFEAALLDPPRAGALAQIKNLAASKVKRIAYVSCDAASFARDARILCDGGYDMGPVTPVDQFLYSDHIELVAGFKR